MPKLTVITPTILGREAFLQVNKGSVESQLGGPLPHLVEGDLAGEGPSAVRNRLARRVETPWMLFLDDDDWLEFDYYQTVEPFLTDDNDVVYTWCKRIGFDAELDRDFDADVLRAANFIPVTACVRTETFRNVGGFPSGVAYEDWALWIKILDAGGKFNLIKERKWTYRRHAGSRTHQNQRDVSTGRISER